MRCFELVSGLRLNLKKFYVMKIGKSADEEMNWDAIFRCPKASPPISYLSLPLGGRPSSRLFWKDLIQCIENRLAPWKKCFLNKGGRLVLIKAVMSNIPNCYMSIFKILISVA
ncbi:hypothetical protein Dsin_005882 [Dipteronia sinensis]|uniref:Uncharacterized protein n=1 Tax=Dipteronia sinensis TaxID=43782 RepID=A0AAE0AYD5_9ROSI|nr:hypothetical protein Dsin_005882 [Dipteronia sinensis]